MLRPHGDWPAAPESVSRVGILAGTFDPLTVAHTALGEAALADGCEVVVYVVPQRSVGKENRAGHADRLAALARRFAGDESVVVASSVSGLYVDLAAEAAATFPAATVDMVCGADKVAQILDPAYYDEPLDGVLARLFDHARLLVAPRGGVVVPRHPHVVELPFRDDMVDVSSTRLRSLRDAGADVTHLLG